MPAPEGGPLLSKVDDNSLSIPVKKRRGPKNPEGTRERRDRKDKKRRKSKSKKHRHREPELGGAQGSHGSNALDELVLKKPRNKKKDQDDYSNLEESKFK